MPYADPAEYRFYQRGYQKRYMRALAHRWRAMGACVECGEPFVGHKRRVICRLCANPTLQPVAAPGREG